MKQLILTVTVEDGIVTSTIEAPGDFKHTARLKTQDLGPSTALRKALESSVTTDLLEYIDLYDKRGDL